MPTSDPRVDWKAVEQSPEFRELIAARRRFVLPATIFFLSWYLGFILLAGYAPDFMARSAYQGLTVGYCLALTQFVMVFALGFAYSRRAARVFDPLAERAARRALTLAGEQRPQGDALAPGAASGPQVPIR
jgi:uncharacterized membrane protein (DUF485 family)